MFAAVARFLTNAAGPSGVLLALDDLQWAGADALDLLATLVHATSATPLRVVGAYRSTEIRPQDPLAVTLVDLARERLATQTELRPLSPEEASELFASLLENCESVPTAEVTEHVLQRTGGVPFFLTSWAQELKSGAVAGRVTQEVPRDVAQSIRLRMAMTPEETRELLGVVAVVGRSATAELLGVITERPEREVVVALDAACQARLLVEEAEDGYRFTHDVIQEVVETDLGTARRKMLHRRVAQALEREPGPVPIARLAYHYSRSGEHEKAILYLEGAGDHALAMHANAEAEGYYRALIIQLDGLGQALQAARAREKLGLVLRTVARHDHALEELAVAASAFRSAADPEGLARTTAQIAWIHARRGTPQAGVASVRSLLNSPSADNISAHGLAMLYVALAELDLATAHYDAQLVAAERAAEYAQVAQDRSLLAQAVLRRGTALHYLGRMTDACQS